MFDADEMLGWVREQADLGPRRPGSAADLRGEALIEEKLRRFGLEDVRREPIAVAVWDADRARLGLDGGPVECFAIPYTAFTGPDGRDAPLVWADPTRLRPPPASWRGAIVVAEIAFPPFDIGLMTRVALGLHDPDRRVAEVRHPATFVRLGWHLYREAVRAGAVGFVGVLRDQPGGSCRMYAPYGFRDPDILDKPLPGVWVGRADGDRLRRAAARGARARLTVTGRRDAGVTHNVVGEIPGDGDEVVVLSCHHDSPFASPVEDASGVAVVLALARHLARRRGLRRRVIVLLSAGHFYGSIGTRSFIRDHLDVVRRTVLEISIEHLAREAVEDGTGRLVPTGHPEPTGVFVPLNRAVADAVLAAVRGADLRGTILLPAEGPLGDYPPTDGGDWWHAGVPVINWISNPVYLLTDDDALRWVDPDRMVGVARAFAEVIPALDRLPRAALAAVDSRAYRLLMKVLARAVQARVTWLGRRPIH